MEGETIMKKWTTILLLALLAALCLAVSCKNDPPPHEHEFDLTAWEYNEDSHWRKAVCEHKDEVKDKAAHAWDDGTVTTSAAPGNPGVMTYKCTVCKHTKTEPIPAQGATRFASTYTPGKTYDKTPIEIDSTKVVRVVGGTEVPVPQEQILKVEFKTKDAEDSAYTATAPTNAGNYTVKVTVAGTPEWEEDAFTQNFAIGAIVLVGSYTHPTELTYNGEEQTLPDLTLNHEHLDCILKGDEVRITYIKTKSADAGTAYVSYAIPGGQNYRSEFNDSKFGIKATVKPIVVNTFINATKVYDGNATIIHKDWTAAPEILPEDKEKLELWIKMEDANVVSEGEGVIDSYEFRYRIDTGMLSLTGNYKIDRSLLKGTIVPKKLTAKTIPTKVYDGTNIVELPYDQLEGLVGSDNPFLSITMSGKDVGAEYESHVVKFVSGAPASNYYVADDDPNMLQANITKKVLQFPSLNVTARPDAERYVYVHLGKANLEGWYNKPVGDDVVKVKYENNSESWTFGKSFLAASGSGTISEISNGNYDVQIPNTSRITVIPQSTYLGNLEVGTPKTFTVSDKTVKFSGTFSMNEDRVMKITNDAGAVMTMENLLTLGEGSKNTILYQENLEDNQGILINSYPNGGTGDFYVHGLAPGKYTIRIDKIYTFNPLF